MVLLSDMVRYAKLSYMYNTRKAGQPLSRYRSQKGTLIKRSDAVYIRFYRDGENGQRSKVTERLCDLDTSTAKREQLAASHMSGVNGERLAFLHVGKAEAPITVGGFWSATYLPWAKANLSVATAKVYESNWRMYVRPELENQVINTFTTVDACELLDYLATLKNTDGGTRLNKNTLSHVKSLCSGIFATAVRKGIIKINPWREAKVSVKERKVKPRVKYTPLETVAILHALEEPDAKLFFAMCAVMGMRPSEVAGASWENVNWLTNVYHVCQAAPYGILGDTKTENSKREIVITETVLSPLTAWYEACKKPSTGLLFTNNKGGPVNHNAWVKYNIDPYAKKACARWCGLYAGRHGAATAMLNLTGDIRASYQLLGNTYDVVQGTYVEPDTSAGVIGQNKYEEALKAASEKHLKQ